MVFAELLMWLLVAVVFYTYIGYGFVLWLLGRKRERPGDISPLPRIAHVIAAYNEEEVIREKILNCGQVNYPAELVETIVIADGSTDRTRQIVAQFPNVTLLYQPSREGKVAALNRAVAYAKDVELLVFSDANSFINPDAFRHIAAYYVDPAVGGVAGEKRVVADSDEVPGKAEGVYWKYESRLKQLDSDFYTVVGAAGELFSVRRELFEAVPEQVLLDDLHISLNVCRKGYVVKYEPEAYAIEAPSFSIEDERLRRLRISAGAFQALRHFSGLLNVFRYGRLSFQFFSHRVLRWTVCPPAFPLILILNAFLVWLRPNTLYITMLGLQLCFYTLAMVGSLLVKQKKGGSFFLLPYYFVFMNYSIFGGLRRYLSGTQSVRWEKSRRAQLR